MQGMPAVAEALMSEDDITVLRAVILARIEFLLVMIDENARSAFADSPAKAPDNMFYPAGEPRNNPVADNAIEQAQQELTQLTRNLSWLETESAGVCEHCGCDISLERLKRVPATRACSQCA